MGLKVNMVKLAEIFGVHRQTITTYQKKGMPYTKAKTGTKGNIYDTEVCIKWYIADVSANSKYAGGEEVGANYEVERTRLTKNQADVKELEVKKMSGELVNAIEMQQTYERNVVSARNTLLVLPSKITQMLGLSSDDEDIIEIEMKRTLAALGKSEFTTEDS